jgi:superfamily II DNA or RNA helicase
MSPNNYRLIVRLIYYKTNKKTTEKIFQAFPQALQIKITIDVANPQPYMV